MPEPTASGKFLYLDPAAVKTKLFAKEMLFLLDNVFKV